MAHVVTDVLIADVLAELGYREPDAQREARAALIAAGLTNARKDRIATAKIDAVTRVLSDRFLLTCSRAACRAVDAAGAKRTRIQVSRQTDCMVCGGSPNRAEVDRAIEIVKGRGWSRVVVVGGSPGTAQALQDAVASRIELRIVSGTDRRTARDAKSDLAWADVVVVWGSTELDHKVSKLYTDARERPVVTCSRRGIGAVAATLIEAARAITR